MSENRALALDLAENAKTFLENCGDNQGIEASRTAGQAAEKFRADIKDMFSSKEHATAVGLEIEKLNGWFSRYPTPLISATNGEVRVLQFVSKPFVSLGFRRMYYEDQGKGQGKFLQECDGWRPLE
ncbi:MAG: hypothetical protein JSS83_18645 [Cyanobacteria bacterium SZAS LIN-3]|nr:hypothetical protein [Cyanobacteria bacterium SZAS LIN-3]